MANTNVPVWTPRKEIINLEVDTASLPGNSNVTFDAFQVPTIPRPDGVSTGGSSNVRLVVEKATLMTGRNAGGQAGTFTLELINASNSNKVMATSSVTAGAQIAAGTAKAFTVTDLGTTTTRNSVAVPDAIALADDILRFKATGTNAGDTLGLGATLQVQCRWEEQ
jgi:hypothetical protein